MKEKASTRKRQPRGKRHKVKDDNMIKTTTNDRNRMSENDSLRVNDKILKATPNSKTAAKGNETWKMTTSITQFKHFNAKRT